MPLLITHLFLTVMCFDLFRDLTTWIRIRNKDLALLGLSGALPDLDILLVPFLGWGYHKLFTHNFIAAAIFFSAMLSLFALRRGSEPRIFLLAGLAYAGHIALDYGLRAVPLLYPWSPSLYGIQVLGSPSEYLAFTTFDTSAYALMFIYFMLTGFKTFRYKFDLPPSEKWFHVELEEGKSKRIRLTTGFFFEKGFDCVLAVQPPQGEAEKATGRRRINVFISDAADPFLLYFASTFYEREPEYAHDANLIIDVKGIVGGRVKMGLLPANYTVLVELLETVSRRKFFRFESLEKESRRGNSRGEEPG